MLAADAPRLVTGEQLRRCAPSRLLLEIDVRRALPGGVADDEARGVFVDGPRRRETARGGHAGQWQNARATTAAAARGRLWAVVPPQQLRQLGDVHSDAPGLVAGEMRRRAASSSQ
jgi:hypothetical protein